MITAVIPVSPIPSHPDTAVLDETIASIRHHLPDAEIVITFDGIRPEQADRAQDYAEHIRRMLWTADHRDGHICPWVFRDHHHQVAMMRSIIDEITTPLVLYIEQDTPLVTDLDIDFGAIAQFLLDEDRSDVVRLHFESVIPEVHTHLMHGFDAPAFLRTSQWSQRPHVATTAYYRRILADHFTADANCFIEDKMHGVVQDAFHLGNPDQHRLHIWTPEDGNLKRSYHLDGRAGDIKFETEQRF